VKPNPDKTADFREIAWRFLRRVRGKILFALACMAGCTAAQMLAPWPLKIIFDHILLEKPLPPSLAWLGGLLHAGPARAVLAVSLAIPAVAVLSSLFSYFQQATTSSLGHQLVYTLRCELLAHLQELSLAYHNRSRTGELLARVTGETEALKDVFVESVLLSFSHLLTIAGMFVILFLLDWRLSLAAMAAFPLLFLALARLYGRVKLATRRLRRHEGRIAARLQEVLSSVRLVKAYGRERYEQARFERESAHTLAEGLRMERMAALATETVELIKSGVVWATLFYGALLVLERRLTPGTLLVFIAYLNEMYKPLRSLARVSARFSRAVVSVQRISEILDTEPEQWNDRGAVVASRLACEIVFDRVSFGYGGADDALKDVSFRIAPGQHVALVGSSGSGKSTLVNLILRFHHATQGVIRLDGVNIERYQRESLRREIGVALQDSLLFGASIRENIAYGKPDATIREIETAARQANADEFICALPDGYDTILGERGSTLSGGQRQRLCLARAFIKNPSVLILDEPTSSVDAESAARIHAAVAQLRRGQTTIVIAHHFSFLEHFDRILVLRRGRLVEQGTHHELLQLEGDYYRMFQRRAAK
jgi:ATP-binding cassette, subfamily B, bacterial